MAGVAFACDEGKTAYLVAVLVVFVSFLDQSLWMVTGALVAFDAAVVYFAHLQTEA